MESIGGFFNQVFMEGEGEESERKKFDKKKGEKDLLKILYTYMYRI